MSAGLLRLRRAGEAAGRVCLSDAYRIRLERRIRGGLESRRLRRADAAVVSFGKSGRTWLRVMLSRYYAIRYALPEQTLLEYDNFYRRERRVPRVLFTHDNYIGDWVGERRGKRAYAGVPTVLLVRDPIDTAVSQYFQWAYRMRAHKKELNAYPPLGADIDVYDFVMDERGGLPRIVAFLNDWAGALTSLERTLLVRYETLREAASAELTRVVGFLGEPGDAGAVANAVDYAAFERMRERERRAAADVDAAPSRLAAADQANPDSFKARRAKVGGYRDYLTSEQIRTVDAYVNEQLDPVFGYRRDVGALADASSVRGGPAR